MDAAGDEGSGSGLPEQSDFLDLGLNWSSVLSVLRSSSISTETTKWRSSFCSRSGGSSAADKNLLIDTN